MWEPILLTMLAAAGNTIGKVLQKQGTKGLPRLSFSLKVMRTYISSRTWVSGFLFDILGALLMLRAVSKAPISILQPVSGCGLAILAVFSHFYLHETMNALDWIGVALAGAGTIGVGMVGEENERSELHLTCLLWFIPCVTLLFGTLDFWTRYRKQKRRAHEHADSPMMLNFSHIDVMEEVVAGMEAGAFFGMAAAVSRVGFLLRDRGYSNLWIPAGIAAGICCSGSGFFCQTRGLKDGRAVVVSTCTAVASIVTGVTVGLLALGESVPVSSSRRLLLFIGWLLIILGVVILMDSARIGFMLPRSIRRFLKLKANSLKFVSPPRFGSSSWKESNPSTIVPFIPQVKISHISKSGIDLSR